MALSESDHPAYQEANPSVIEWGKLTDKEVFAAFQNNTNGAFDELHKRYNSRLTNYIKIKYSLSVEDAEDIVQEFWINMLRNKKNTILRKSCSLGYIPFL